MVKPGYKQTEIGIIPENWDAVPFDSCFQVLKNNTLSRAELNDDAGILRNIHYGDVLIRFGCVLNADSVKIPFVTEPRKNVPLSVLKDGDLVIADTAEDETVGKAVEIKGAAGKKIVSGLHTIPCRPQDPDMFANGWLGYFINHTVFHDQLLPLITGTKVSAISKSALSNTIVAVPRDKKEQERIVEALTDADDFISSLEKLIEKKKEIKQGAMQQLLTGKIRLPGFEDTWNKYMIEDMGFFYGGLSGKSKKDFGHGKARFITFLNVLSNSVIDTHALERVDVQPDEKQNAVKQGDLFFNGSSETPEEVGMCAALINNVANTYLNSFCFGFRLFSEEHDPLFLAYYFNGKNGREIMRALAQGATRYNLSKTSLLKTKIRIPTGKEQRVIANVIRDMEKGINALEFKLEKARLVKQGMMQQLLTGKLRLIEGEE